MTAAYFAKAGVIFAAIALLARQSAKAYHPFKTFGPANQVTMVRALLVALIAAFIADPALATFANAIVAAACAALILDGLDGWLARRTAMASAFGARFDMEIDALLIQVLAILAWQLGKAGAWVLASGLLRYVFVAAGWLWTWMTRPLFPSLRRKTICVVQIAGLILTILPAVPPSISPSIAAVSLAVLSYSFLVDTAWLFQTHRAGE